MKRLLGNWFRRSDGGTVRRPHGPLSRTFGLHVEPLEQRIVPVYFAVTAPASVTAGVPFTVTVTTRASLHEIVSPFQLQINGTATLTAGDGQLAPTAVTLTKGMGSVQITLDRADTTTLGAVDGSISGVSSALTVSGVGPVSLAVSAPAQVTAGVSFTATVTGTDVFGNPANGTVTLTSGDGQLWPTTVTLTNGTSSAPIVLYRADTTTLKAASGVFSGVSGSLTVNSAALAALAVSAPATVTAGVSFTGTVTGTDAFGNPAGGQVFVVNVGWNTLVNGRFTDTITEYDAGTTQLQAISGSIFASDNILVRPGNIASVVVNNPSSVMIGQFFSLTLTAYDAYGNVETGSVPLATLSANGGMAVLPNVALVVNGSSASPVEIVAAAVGTQSAAVSIQITAAIGNVRGTGTITVYPDWFSANLSDPAIQNAARGAFQNHGYLSYNDWLNLFTTGESENPSTVTFNEMASYQTLLANASWLGTPAYVSYLASQVLYGIDFNYQYLNGGGSVVSTALPGILAAGFSTYVLTDRVNTWFLGMNEPTAYVIDSNGNVTTTANTYYPASSSTLYEAGMTRPYFWDVNQRDDGDCWLMASLAAAAADQPGLIESMFTYDGTNVVNGNNILIGQTVGVWTVRFLTSNGTPNYVTVDTELPAGGGDYAQVYNGALWVALAEKAYAEASSFGFVPAHTSYGNSYSAINGGDPANALTAITGQTATDFNNPGGLAANLFPAVVASEFEAGNLVVLGTSSPQSSEIVGNHAYALIGYDSSSSATLPFTLYNPWGIAGSSSQNVYGLFSCNAPFLYQNFSYTSFAAAPAAAPPPAIVPPTIPAEPFTSAGAAAAVNYPPANRASDSAPRPATLPAAQAVAALFANHGAGTLGQEYADLGSAAEPPSWLNLATGPWTALSDAAFGKQRAG